MSSGSKGLRSTSLRNPLISVFTVLTVLIFGSIAVILIYQWWQESSISTDSVELLVISALIMPLIMYFMSWRPRVAIRKQGIESYGALSRTIFIPWGDIRCFEAIDGIRVTLNSGKQVDLESLRVGPVDRIVRIPTRRNATYLTLLNESLRASRE